MAGFNIDKFYSCLQPSGYEVTQLEDAGARSAWGDHFNRVVLKKSVRVQVRLFDNRPQAQFVRCLAPPQNEARSASHWLKLAHLYGGLGAAFGAGLKGDAGISLDKGKFILNLKASVLLGPGVTGSFRFEIRYEAQAQQQLEDSCKSMDKFGELSCTLGQTFCESRYKFDGFMGAPVLRYPRKDGNCASINLFSE